MSSARSRLLFRSRSVQALCGALIALACALALQAAPAGAYEIVGLNTEVPSKVVSFSDSNPRQVMTQPVEFPLGATDTDLLGLAYRPGTDDLYAVGSEGTVYVLTGSGPYTAVPLGPTPVTDPITGTLCGRTRSSASREAAWAGTPTSTPWREGRSK